MAAVRAPLKVGLKVTVNVALLPGAMLAEGVETLKSPAWEPSFVMLMPLSSEVPVLRMVKVVAALLLPTLVVGRETLPVPSVRFAPDGCSNTISGAAWVIDEAPSASRTKKRNVVRRGAVIA